MTGLRRIRLTLKSKPTIEGAGVRLKRVFGFHQVPQFDPFLLLDDFHSNHPDHYLKGFPWHPHRGIETITYLLRGTVEHGDSLGNKGVIREGDIQWMTAGSGIVHQEMPRGDNNGSLWGFQLWANLPASDKMMAPRYRDVLHSDIPTVTTPEGAIIKIISGQIQSVTGPVKDIVIEPEYLDISLPANCTFRHPTNYNHTVFAYVMEGCAYFDPAREPLSHETGGMNYFDMNLDCIMKPESLILYQPGDHVEITTNSDPARFLLISGMPINEPVAWYGPIVMNTQEELKLAFDEYQQGSFIKK